MNNEQLEKKLFETALRHAVTQCVEDECAPVREEYMDSPEPDYSLGFRLRMKRLIQKNKRRTGAGWTVYGKRAASIAIVFCIGFFSVMSVDALRIPITDFFFSVTEQGTFIDLDGGDGSNKLDIPKGWDFVYSPTYLPKGYKLEKTEFYEFGFDAIYNAGEGQEIYFTQEQSFGGELALDTEDAITEQVTIGESNGMYIEKNGRSMIFWSKSDSWFLLTATLGREETIKIAESLEKIEK